MRIEHFRYLINNEVNGFFLTDNIMMFRKPIEIWYKDTGESITFKTLDEALDYKIGSETVREMILRMDGLRIPEID